VVEFRGLAALTIREAFREMEAVAMRHAVPQFLLPTPTSTRGARGNLPPAQWDRGQPPRAQRGLADHRRFVVEHARQGAHIGTSCETASTRTA